MKQVILLLVFLAPLSSVAQQQYSHSGEGPAFDGNDLTEYYNDQAVKGSSEYAYEYDGLTLYFKNQENLNKFKNDPEKYFPAYGGWCATAIANGSFARPDFNNFKVQNGELLFFEVKAFFNGKTQWEKDPEFNKTMADVNYKNKTKK